MGKLRLALIAGGKSSEREVSLKSGAQVYQALNKDRYDIRRYDPLTDLERLVRDAGELDAALIIMHGRGGEDGSMQGLLDLLEIPYQGSGILASALAMNKELSKAIYQMAGLQVPAALAFHRHKAPSPPEIEAKLGLPVVIKPVNEGSSIGISKAPTLEALETGLATAFALDNRVLVEEFIQGTEITGAVLGNAKLQALPLVEIIPASTYAFFDYEAKYQPGATEEICPARLSPDITKRAQECALIAHQALGCRGYSRTDMMIREQNIYVLETNTIPGMTATSLFPQGAKAAGIEFPDLLDTLITLAREKV
ncbi:MAG: D-alanine--D-alanine ligase [Desulfobacterales bacterium]|nr:D-alanine--D-alanine ligase [Pseudomonadota bacterium]MBU4355291.1 D-alanine--D-alanine ligase [Pseudomonadota bacterium]MCG2770995.1 D-alanine--D-alanine ligase [Desulfobacterales bacterium]